MRLNHLDLQFVDVPAAAAYFVRWFDFELLTNGTSPAIALLRDESGFSLVLQRKASADEGYPDGFHIGFLLETPEAVRAHHARLAAGGAGVGEVAVTGRGTQLYLRGPEGVLIEVSCPRR